jgi:hypothetical protein
MHTYRQRRFHVCRTLLNKKDCSMAQSFLRLLIQFTGIAKLHSGNLSRRIRFVIIKDIIFSKMRLVHIRLAGPGVYGAPLAWHRRWAMLGTNFELRRTAIGFAYR